jgi:DNA-binding cell septation regulator SpoVG
MNIEIIEIRFPKSDKATQAFCDVIIDRITIRDFRIMHNGGRHYVKAPFQTYKNSAGDIQFRQIVDLPDEVREQVDTLILSTFYREKEMANGSTHR